MTGIAIEGPNLHFPVEMMDLPHPARENEKIEGRKAIVRTDTNQILNIVSSKYKLIRHADVFGAIDEAVARVGIPILGVKSFIGDNGASAMVRWKLDMKIEVGDQDSTHVEIVGRNSYDYSKMLGLQLGAFRLICSNGATIGEILAKYVKRHTQGLKIEDALNEIQGYLNQVPKIESAWRQWNSIEYPVNRFQTWLGSRPEVSKKMGHEITEYYQVQPDRIRAGLETRYTGWEAYNALTWFGTHRVQSRKPGRELVSKELVNSLADYFAAAELGN